MRERPEREVLKKNRLAIEDKVFRAYGAMLYSRILESKEAMDGLNLLRFGIECEMISASTTVGYGAVVSKSEIAYTDADKAVEQDKDIPVDVYRGKVDQGDSERRNGRRTGCLKD